MKVQNIKKIDKLKYLKAYEIEYLDKKGASHYWELVSRGDINRLEKEAYQKQKFTDGSTIFAYSKSKKEVVIIQEYRPCIDGYVYSLPAGLSDDSEDIKTCAIREFKEETGLDLNYKSHIASRYTSVGITNEKTSLVYGEFSGEISNKLNEACEDIKTMIIDREKAVEILENHECTLILELSLRNFFGINAWEI